MGLVVEYIGEDGGDDSEGVGIEEVSEEVGDEDSLDIFVGGVGDIENGEVKYWDDEGEMVVMKFGEGCLEGWIGCEIWLIMLVFYLRIFV